MAAARTACLPLLRCLLRAHRLCACRMCWRALPTTPACLQTIVPTTLPCGSLSSHYTPYLPHTPMPMLWTCPLPHLPPTPPSLPLPVVCWDLWFATRTPLFTLPVPLQQLPAFTHPLPLTGLHTHGNPPPPHHPTHPHPTPAGVWLVCPHLRYARVVQPPDAVADGSGVATLPDNFWTPAPWTVDCTSPDPKAWTCG